MINLCERAGSGVPKILKAVKENHYKYPDIKETKDSFTLRFQNIEKSKVLFYKIQEDNSLSNEEKQILDYLLINHKIKNSNIQEEFNLTRSQAGNLLKKLIKKNYIEKYGVGKNTYYKSK